MKKPQKTHGSDKSRTRGDMTARQIQDSRDNNQATYAEFVRKLNYVSDMDIENALTERKVQMSLR